MHIKTRLQALFRLTGELFRLCPFCFFSIRIRPGKARQDWRAFQRAIMTALRNHNRVLKRLRQIGEQLHHLLAGLETVLRCQLTSVGLNKNTAFRNRDQSIMRFIIIRVRKERFVGRDDWNVQIISKIQELRLNIFLALHIVALQLHIKAIPKRVLQQIQTGLGKINMPFAKLRVDRPLTRPRQNNHAT